jgi:indole-3-glycerol phosphate synthase
VNVLAEIVADTRRELVVRREERSLSELGAAAEHRLATQGAPRSLRDAVGGAGALAVIAEHKRSSPSAGVIRADRSLQQVISAYDRGGAAAVSVLTEGSRFGGSLADLEAARALTELPLLRKDFIVDPYQLHEALAAGGDAVLLIVAAIDDHELASLLALASSLGLDALVEVHDRRELARAASAGAPLIGINNRDLTTLAVDVRRTFELLDEVPAGAVVVAESGFSERAQLDELWKAGVHGVLIGEALMRADDIEMACQALTGVARRPR